MEIIASLRIKHTYKLHLIWKHLSSSHKLKPTREDLTSFNYFFGKTLHYSKTHVPVLYPARVNKLHPQVWHRTMVTDIEAGIQPVTSPKSGGNSLQLSSSDKDMDPVPFLTPAIRQLTLHSSVSCVWLCLYCIKSKYNFLIHRYFLYSAPAVVNT